MNKKRAIAVLASQKDKLNNSYQLGDFIWLHSTRHYIEQIFTKESESFVLLSSFRPIDSQDTLYNETVSKLNKMFDEWTEMIESGAF